MPPIKNNQTFNLTQKVAQIEAGSYRVIRVRLATVWFQRISEDGVTLLPKRYGMMKTAWADTIASGALVLSDGESFAQRDLAVAVTA